MDEGALTLPGKGAALEVLPGREGRARLPRAGPQKPRIPLGIKGKRSTAF